MSEQRFLTPHPVTLEVRLASAELRVATTDGNESTVSLTGSPKLAETVRVELVGDRLVIQQRRRSLMGIFDRFDAQLSLDVAIPEGSGLDIATAAGLTTLTGNFSEVHMKSASGDLVATGQISGDVRVDGVSGTIRLPHIRGALSARTVSGDVFADSVQRSATVRSVSGDVRIGSLTEGTTTVQSVSGKVDLGIAVGTSLDVDAASAAGRLSSEIPLSDVRSDDSAPVVVIRGHTVSGDFHVFRAA